MSASSAFERARAGRDPELAARWEAHTAEQITASLGELRGAVMKVGQMLSYLDHRLPPAMRTALAHLQEDAPRMAPELAASVVEDELGRPPTQVFARWEAEPIAAASIGQVHRAITKDGRAVAVKVQFPGVDRAVLGDLAALKVLLRPLRAIAPVLDTNAIAAEIQANIAQELDYRLEAANQAGFAARFRGHPHISVPEVHGALSTRRVLVTDLAGGYPLDQAARWDQRERDLAGETLFRFASICRYEHGAVHGDLHPGNLRFHGGGRITVLDFGLVRTYDEDDCGLIAECVLAWRDQDAGRLGAALGSLGYVDASGEVDSELLLAYFGCFVPLLQQPGRSGVPPSATSDLVDAYHAPRFEAVRSRTTFPPAMVFLHRANLGLHGVLAELQPVADWWEVQAECAAFGGRIGAGPLATAHARWSDALRPSDDGSVPKAPTPPTTPTSPR